MASNPTLDVPMKQRGLSHKCGYALRTTSLATTPTVIGRSATLRVIDWLIASSLRVCCSRCSPESRSACDSGVEKMNVEALSRAELLTLLSILEGELEAQDVVIHTLRILDYTVSSPDRKGNRVAVFLEGKFL
ncbi:hypothetical protein XENOCAPTIV_008737 [Xenoophorus captivus]|uniref:Cortactin-binding protein-2 N-terminal domain-containing protein n=1 Tax=Xenoophorus captivus TaxID=1517983 RepID=A0ABV0R7P5_9TELE